MRKLIALGLGILAITGTASAQTATTSAAAAATPALAIGATVYEPGGTVIGTIDAINPDGVIVSTGTSKVAIPAASFGIGDKGPVLAATRAQLDGAAAQAAAATLATLKASLVPGAEIRGVAGANVVGSVKSLDAEFVVVTTPRGEVRLPITAFGNTPKGLVIGMSSAEFDAAVAAATKAG